MSGKHIGGIQHIRDLVSSAMAEMEAYTKVSGEKRFGIVKEAASILRKQIPEHPYFSAFESKGGLYHDAYLKMLDILKKYECEMVEFRYKNLRQGQHSGLPYPVESKHIHVKDARIGNLNEPLSMPAPHPLPQIPNVEVKNEQAPTENLTGNKITPHLLKQKFYVSDSVFLLDVRMRAKFDMAHITGSLIACLEPTLLRQGMSLQDIQDVLAIFSHNSSFNFEKVREFDTIVVYDDDSIEISNSPKIQIVFNAFSSSRIHCCLLTGGFRAWVNEFPNLIKSEIERKVPELYRPPPPQHAPPPKIPDKVVPTRTSSLGYTDDSTYSSASPIMQPLVPQSAGNSHYMPTRDLKIPPVPLSAPPKPPILPASKYVPSPNDGYADKPAKITIPSLRVGRLLSNNNRQIPHIQYSEESVPPHLLATTGLRNLGNTCYMNCIIQCIMGVPKLIEPFINGMYKQYINYNSRFGHQGAFAITFATLAAQMLNSQYPFVDATNLKQLSARLRPDSFAGYDQQDCQEFLSFLLDGLHEDLNLNGDKPKEGPLDAQAEERREAMGVQTASAVEWERYLKGDTSLIVDLFQGQYLSQLQCLTCKRTSTTYNPFSSLSLPIAVPMTSKLLNAQQHTSLKTCFDEFVKPEILDGDNAWNCPHCHKKRKSLKILKISRLPQYLIIHLKRFKRSTMGTTTKLEVPVDYPLRNLDLTKYWPQLGQDDNPQLEILHRIPSRGQHPPFIYDLRAVALHHGSLQGGHYTAVVQKPGKGWYYFDDTNVSLVKEQFAVSKYAYVLIYKRREN